MRNLENFVERDETKYLKSRYISSCIHTLPLSVVVYVTFIPIVVYVLRKYLVVLVNRDREPRGGAFAVYLLVRVFFRGGRVYELGNDLSLRSFTIASLVGACSLARSLA